MWSDGGMKRRASLVVGPLVVAAAVLLLLTGCIASPERGDSHPQRLPLGIARHIVAGCEQSVGLGGSAPVTAIWRDSQGIHVRIGHGSRFAVGSGGGMSATESALLSCLTIARGSQPDYPTDSAGLLLLWRYSTTVLWPCYAQHGLDVGPSPSRATFLRGDPLQINPLDQLRGPVADELWAQVQRDCPSLPAYLATATPDAAATPAPPSTPAPTGR
jgi:hypothetical protein